MSKNCFKTTLQSTSPARGKTYAAPVLSRFPAIASIHFPREGKTAEKEKLRLAKDASIHFPREGEDQDCFLIKSGKEMLQSTSPARGKTPGFQLALKSMCASIHFPREGEDKIYGWHLSIPGCFNPLPPRGGRPARVYPDERCRMLQSTSPARGKTAKNTTNSIKALLTFVYYFYIYTNIPK